MASATSTPRLQVAQILADLSDLNVAEPESALALVTANRTLSKKRQRSNPKVSGPSASRFDSMSSSGLRSRSSTPASFSREDSMVSERASPGSPIPPLEVDPDLERASTLISLYESRGRIKQQENMGLVRARANVEAVSEKYRMILDVKRSNQFLRP